MSNGIKNKILVFLTLITALNPLLAHAQTAPPAKEPLPQYAGVDSSLKEYLCTPSDNPTGDDLPNCINKLYRFGIAFGSIALVFFMIVAGYLYITGGETGKQKGKSVLKNALIGMAILLSSYLLLGFINPDLTKFKAINPPVFKDPGLPKNCISVGMEGDCGLPPHGDGVENVGAGGIIPKGTATACKSGIVDTPASIPHRSPQASKLCKDLVDKLSNLKSKTYGVDWILYSSISGTHSSGCHSPGNANSGNCVDIALNGGRSPSYSKNNGGSTNTGWGKICQGLAALGGVNFANEASNQTACEQLKPYKPETYTTGPNIHVNLSVIK